MVKRRGLIIGGIAFFLWICVSSALAASVTYQFAGTLNSSTAAGISVGTPIAVSFTYDPLAFRIGGGGNYSDYGSTIGRIDAQLPTYSFHTGLTFSSGFPFQMTTVHVAGFIGSTGVPDGIYDALTTVGLNTNTHFVVNLNFYDANLTEFASSLDLPAALPTAHFEYIWFSGYIPGQSGVGTVTALLQPVPEPSTAALLGCALAAISRCARSSERRRGPVVEPPISHLPVE